MKETPKAEKEESKRAPIPKKTITKRYSKSDRIWLVDLERGKKVKRVFRDDDIIKVTKPDQKFIIYAFWAENLLQLDTDQMCTQLKQDYLHPSNFKFIEFYEQSEKDYGQDLPISTPILIHESIVKDNLSLFKILHKSFRYKERHRMSYNHDGSFDLMKMVDTAKNTSNWKGQESEPSDFPEVMQFIVHDKPYSL